MNSSSGEAEGRLCSGDYDLSYYYSSGVGFLFGGFSSELCEGKIQALTRTGCGIMFCWESSKAQEHTSKNAFFSALKRTRAFLSCLM